MRLHFDVATLARLLEDSERAEQRIALYDQMTPTLRKSGGVSAKVPVGLWLAGDEGVYFASNGHPPLVEKENADKRVVAYAEEADPTRHPETHRDVKDDAFGHDDGRFFISRALVLGILAESRDGIGCIDLTPSSLIVMAPLAGTGATKARRPLVNAR